MRAAGVLLVFLLFQGCQSLKKEAGPAAGPRSIQIDSKIKVINRSQDKSYSAKGTWFLSYPGLMRLDILGPFDILMAQGFRDPQTISLVDHRQKTVMSQSSNKPLVIDGFEVPISELVYLLLDTRPRGWSCQPSPHNKLNCQQGSMKAIWPERDLLVLSNPPYEVEVKIREQNEIENPGPSTFRFIQPKSYRSIKTGH